MPKQKQNAANRRKRPPLGEHGDGEQHEQRAGLARQLGQNQRTIEVAHGEQWARQRLIGIAHATEVGDDRAFGHTERRGPQGEPTDVPAGAHGRGTLSPEVHARNGRH
jgi:hypothetical protein